MTLQPTLVRIVSVLCGGGGGGGDVVLCARCACAAVLGRTRRNPRCTVSVLLKR